MAGQGALKGSQTFVESFQIWIGSPAQYLGKSHGYGRYLGSGALQGHFAGSAPMWAAQYTV